MVIKFLNLKLCTLVLRTRRHHGMKMQYTNLLPYLMICTGCYGTMGAKGILNKLD